MTTAAVAAPGRGTFARGIHPAGCKQLAADAAIEVLPAPPQVSVPLHQHAGAPAEAIVKYRQKVAWGEVLGHATGLISASVHSPVAGVVLNLTVTTLPNGRHVRTVPVRTEGQQVAGEALWEDVLGGEWPRDGLEKYTPEQVVQAARDAGLTGLGGAAFPTHVKLARNEKKPIDSLLVNGCECEPYLTADYRLMVEAPGAVVSGALLAARAVGAPNIYLAVEDNKPAAVDALRRASAGTAVQVVEVRTRYPMGGERQLAVAALGREVPTGGLPLDVGLVVVNVGTAAALARAVLRGKPLTHRVVTISGAGIVQPKNLLAPVGASYEDLIKFCGGLRPEAARVLAGGPMMGFAVGQLNTPITKGTSGITVLTREEVWRVEETACVRCGRCVDVCPLRLVPTKMAIAAQAQDWELAKRYYLTACCECGCCAYACPARIPLTQLIRMGKALMPK